MYRPDASFYHRSPLQRWLTGAALALALGLPLSANAQFHQPLDPQYDLPLDELRSFAEVYERIKQAYVHEVDDRTLLENAIRGMLSGLDPHSGYLEPEAFRELRESTEGSFGGLGIEIGIEEGYIKVISPIDDTPASRAGLQPHDLITRINDTPTRDMSVDKAIELMRGEPGTRIRLTIQRQNVNQPFEVELERAEIRITSVRHRLLEPGFGYLRISQFQNRSGDEAREAIKRLQQESETPLQGMILDLRNNPGGVLQAAADVADIFLDGGLIVYTKGRLPDTEMRFDASPGDALEGIPLIVLINGGSASASEIVAGALQDHRRALVMGTPSFGKGSVQTVLPLNNDRALKMTTALYYTPGDRSIQADGIHPDIEVVNARITPLEMPVGTREADLEGHLGGQQPREHSRSTAARLSTSDDYPLNEALNLLKGLVIFRSQ
ncbi:S41 family peptidase [Marinospirillum alkaliphilum]|uniref:Carboxyl-terminal processing protease n=1 Tax=Marinospirillum alkaliphilum DSM 21637 TaxID=1122209 RepID=A0A1K1WQ47_9GAMM|nr:S41 family peptidase [Marinospirillum alkaliphilum]SFX39383.1 carboxyl-terminal processing protease [Marinospirillum alkaliphilum DSM 21637]